MFHQFPQLFQRHPVLSGPSVNCGHFRSGLVFFLAAFFFLVLADTYSVATDLCVDRRGSQNKCVAVIHTHAWKDEDQSQIDPVRIVIVFSYVLAVCKTEKKNARLNKYINYFNTCSLCFGVPVFINKFNNDKKINSATYNSAFFIFIAY